MLTYPNTSVPADAARVQGALRSAGVTVLEDTAALLLTHSPDVFPAVPRRVALSLAGHTHGGQVRLPLLGSPVVPSRFGQRYARGHVSEGGRHLLVSTGTGTSILPVRFRVHPEATIVELVPVRAPPGR